MLERRTATARSERGRRSRALIESRRPDVVCLTEAERGVLPADGEAIDAGSDRGYANPTGCRRKVLLWSHYPWCDVDRGSTAFPPGRFAAATATCSAVGDLRVVGVCVPWRDAHVRTGRRDRAPWQDHLAFLDAFAAFRATLPTTDRIVVVGDLNQRVPRHRQPMSVDLARAVALDGMTVATAGTRPIDHVAHGAGLRATSVVPFPGADDRGRLSDHDGVVVVLERAG